jgi:cytochrome c biogenesis protein CcmG/thiol:disulfide interchange protein DsbE
VRVGEVGGPEDARPSPGSRRRRWRWFVVGAGVIVLVPFVFAIARNLGRDPTLAGSPLLGHRAPPFSLTRIDAPDALNSDQLSGRVYVVNFWASWCIPCQQETANLDAFYQRWRGRGVELVGVLHEDTVANARTFHRDFGGSWPLVNDPGDAVGLNYGVRGVPETFVVDSRGIVMARLIGAVGPNTLDELLNRLAAGDGPISTRNSQYRTAP